MNPKKNEELLNVEKKPPKYQGIGKKGNLELLGWSSSGRSWGRAYRLTVGQANTLTTGDYCGNRSSINYVFDGKRFRHLTPNEGEYLMSWPKDHTRWGLKEDGTKVEISKTQRYKMIGNGVVSNCVKPIKNLIIKNENRYRKSKKIK